MPGGGRSLACSVSRVVQQHWEMRKQCNMQLTERMDAEEYRLEYHWAVTPLAVDKQEDDTRVR